jgi:hypothetical protein
VLDNNVKSNSITDCVFWYRADPNLPRFKLGKPVFWELDQRYYRDKEAESDDESVVVKRSVPPAGTRFAAGTRG